MERIILTYPLLWFPSALPGEDPIRTAAAAVVDSGYQLRSNLILILMAVAAVLIITIIVVFLAARSKGGGENKSAALSEHEPAAPGIDAAPEEVVAASAVVPPAVAGTARTDQQQESGRPADENGANNEPGGSIPVGMAGAAAETRGKTSSSGSVEFRTGRLTDVGRVRELNEDSLLTIETARITTSTPYPAGVYVVADGMGGHSAGEVASGAIVNYIQGRCLGELGSVVSKSGVDWLAWIKETVELANEHVYEMRMTSGNDMGSTLVMAMLDGANAYIAHVGDSRAYLVNDREIRRLTVDHSLVERLIAIGQIGPEEAHTHPQRNVIYRTIGDKAHLDAEVKAVELAVGDRLLLCSDGLSGLLTDDIIQKIVVRAADAQSACQDLVSAANQAGGDDNISVIIVQIVLA